MSAAPIAIVSSVGVAGRRRLGAAAALAQAAARNVVADAALLLSLDEAPLPGPGLVATSGVREARGALATRLPGTAAVARGRLCLAAGQARDPAEVLAAVGPAAGELGLPVVVAVRPQRFHAALASVPAASVLIQAGTSAPRPLLALVAIEADRAGRPVRVWPRPLTAIQLRRALAGLDPGGSFAVRSARTARALLPVPRRRPARAGGVVGDADGQAMPAVLGLVAMALAVAMALLAIGAAATAKGRAQRAIDLAALSAARSMRDDLAAASVPARRADGSPDPAHLPRSAYLARAVRAAREAAERNGLPPGSLRIDWPGRDRAVPVQVRVRARPHVVVDGARVPKRVRLAATAAVTPGTVAAPAPDRGSGGGYAGPLAYRQGEPMRPDVARAFDRLAAAAVRAGHALIINSAFRSDAEQAALFAANPDPRWVAPPGRSLHRCGSELDLGPPSAYGWLAGVARRFGFVRRYSWEPWHFGYEGGRAPCATTDRDAAKAAADGRATAGPGLPGFVPPRFRAPLRRAAARHGVSAALLAAQLLVESGFDPAAVSPAGARGIAQFMPATAAAYGLDDPHDPAAAIDAQARLMADLLRRFASTQLALAAYNAGPGPVMACGCVPAYPETEAYVARITGLLGGSAGAPSPATLAVRLVE